MFSKRANKIFDYGYLPPYTPQLNPIDEFFSCLKSRYCLFSRSNKTEVIVQLLDQILETETFHMT